MFFKTTFPTLPGISPSPLEPIAPLTPVTLYGDDTDNDLKGGFNNDSLFGNGGKDHLEGFWGDDVLYGGEDDDELFGGSGDDKIYGNDDGSDADGLFGGSGNDEMQAGSRDFAWGDSGDDTIFLSGRQSNGYGGVGDDTIIRNIDGGRSVLDGGEGDDTLIAFGRGVLDIHRSGDVNVLRGGEGDDTLIMIGGFAEAFGGIGDDTYIFGAIEDGGYFIADDNEGADDYRLWNANHEELTVFIDSFDADDTIHLGDFFDDGVTTLDSNGDGVITRDDDFVFTSSILGVTIVTDNLYLRIENEDFTTTGAEWLAADQIEIA